MEIIIDGSSLFTRCWYAVVPNESAANNPKLIEMVLTAATKSATLLFTSEYGAGVPKKTAFCWEGENKRKKSKRVKKPESFYATRVSYKKIVEILFNTVNVVSDRHEADDVIASMVFKSKSDEIIVVSGDKDLKQLVDEDKNIYYYCLNKKQYATSKNIEMKYGVKKPIQLPIYLAIVGDSVDEIPGIPKWGDKKCKKLFEDITREDGFNYCLEKITEKIRSTGQSNLDSFYESLDLTLLNRDIPNLPEPSPFILANREDLDEIGIDGITEHYQKIFGF